MPSGFVGDPLLRGGGGCLAVAAAGPVEVLLEGFNAGVTRESCTGSSPGKARAPPPLERAPALYASANLPCARDDHPDLAIGEEEEF